MIARRAALRPNRSACLIAIPVAWATGLVTPPVPAEPAEPAVAEPATEAA